MYLAWQMERFLYHLDLFHISIWESDSKLGHSEYWGKKNTLNKRKGDWTNLLTVAFKAGRRKKNLKQHFVFLLKEKCHQVLMKSELLVSPTLCSLGTSSSSGTLKGS